MTWGEKSEEKQIRLRAYIYIYIYICMYISKYTGGKKREEKRVFGAYFSSFISPKRKERIYTRRGVEGRSPPRRRSFDSVYFSRFRIFLVHYQREATHRRPSFTRHIHPTISLSSPSCPAPRYIRGPVCVSVWEQRERRRRRR